MFDPKLNPDATVGRFVDPKTLTASERKYGMAPKRDPHVKYADGVILMEHGDQAIQDAASDGMTWTFDAGAAHVSEFQEGKIIFATGRAVGRIGQITKSGNAVTVKLAPVQINEVIENGHFIVDDDVDTTQVIIQSDGAAAEWPGRYTAGAELEHAARVNPGSANDIERRDEGNPSRRFRHLGGPQLLL